jgi:ATP phosphoribosyltransferase regulatory subunit HisZ
MRGEVTTQVARMLASNAINETRVFYIANCIRFQEIRSISQREFWQAGAEIIGGSEADGDAEAIALALRSLERVGIDDAYVDIGNIALFRELARGLGIENLGALRQAMASKSLADLKPAVGDGRAFQVFSPLIRRRGGIEIIEDLAGSMDKGERYVDYFRSLFGRLEAYGLRGRVSIDLTTLREMDYYNGTVFDIYVGGVGVPIGGGGRYDSMMEEFGMKGVKATGFAVSVDLCVKTLDSKRISYEGATQPRRILFMENYVEKAIGIAVGLRDKGIPCTIDAYKGEDKGILVGEMVTDLATGKEFKVVEGREL